MVKVNNLSIGLDQDLTVIAGPCVIESMELAHETAGFLKEQCEKLGLNFIYKSSFDKANRTSLNGFRGHGIDFGLKVLQSVKEKFNVPVITDVHEDTPLHEVAAVVDVLQTPAFLCRQTNFIVKVANTQKAVNIKKGQFLSPFEMKFVVEKAKSTGNQNIMVTERGASFGYNNLVSDMRSLVIMRDTECPVIYDATHSVQLPGGANGKSGGQSEFVPPLAKAAVAVGVSGVFMETHPNPESAPSDGPNMVKLQDMPRLLNKLLEINKIVKNS